MRKNILLLLLLAYVSHGMTQTDPLHEKYKNDLDFFWQTIKDEYAYFDIKQTNWQQVKTHYTKALDTVQSKEQFIDLLEKVLYEIYDHHAILNTNTSHSFRLVPSGTDIWAEYKNSKAIIIELRRGFGADVCGIRPGMEVIAVNDVPVENAIQIEMPTSIQNPNDDVKSFVLRLLLAGRHDIKRKLTLKYGETVKDYFPDDIGRSIEHIQYDALIESSVVNNIGYIKINDCLYNNDLIGIFDSVMLKMSNTKGLIIDLRETPSGGNTAVARAIIGWFTSNEKFYQKHEYPAEQFETGIKRSWEEIVSPRKGKYYNKPLVILCDHWTGSVGEGIVIGFDALHRQNTLIIGTEMARLNGAVYSFQMPATGIHFGFPAEKLFHINGSPREKFEPAIVIDITKDNNSKDQFMQKAMEFLKNR